VEISLVGGSPKTFEFSLTAAHGLKDLEQKWNLELESEKEARKVCVTGGLEFPLRRDQQDRFKYNNRVGFGSSCDEYFVNVEGFADTSDDQMSQSRKSEAARKCSKLSRKVLTVCS
jgi:hypothetical protein